MSETNKHYGQNGPGALNNLATRYFGPDVSLEFTNAVGRPQPSAKPGLEMTYRPA